MYRGHLLAVALAAIAVQNVAAALSLTEVRIPKHVVHGSTAELECLYDLDGELLYSVKWYKDGDEFFRYVPRDVPPTQVFPLPGISVDMSRSANNRVLLDAVNAATSGRYRCEVSGEAPLFQTVSDHGDLIVVYLPAQEPRITGGRRHYRAGDIAELNCTAGASRPAAQLAWLVNGEAAPRGALRGPWLAVTAGGLHTAVLGLRMVVRSEDFRGGELKFKCLAKISSVYERARENSAEDWEAQQQPAQAESRVPNYAQATTADHAQNSSSASCYKPYAVVMAVIVTHFAWSINRR